MKPYEQKGYKEHAIFQELTTYMDFYSSLSFSMMNWISQGTRAMNFETYVFSSMQGTLESIKVTLEVGRINDAYALLRKYYDAVMTHVYASLYLIDNFSMEDFVVKKIDDWLAGNETLPDYRKMSQYIRSSDRLKQVNAIVYSDEKYKKIRDRCNSQTHYNFFHHMLLNDSEVYNPNRMKYLAILSHDLLHIFILHFVVTFLLNSHYMMSSDHIDYLDVGDTPPEDSQYWVAPFIQKIFTDIVEKNRPDLSSILKASTPMQLK